MLAEKEIQVSESDTCTREFETTLKKGTHMKLIISFEVNKCNKEDLNELLSSYAMNSHQFYLEAAEKLIKSF
ncbi:MAG: hypothetical protein ACERKN_07285 [Velocimicrobium sp.]